MNIFTNLLLAIVILLSKLTFLREFFIMFILGSSTFLRFSLNTYITFQSCRTMLLLATSEVSFFTNSICVFAILTIIVLNFSASNVQTNCFRSTSQKVGEVLNSFALIFLILVIWQFNSFCIPAFLSVIFTMVVTLVFMLFIALIFNMYIKLTCIIGIFINFVIHSFIIFFRIIFRIYYFLTFCCFFFIWPLYCFGVFLLIFYMFLVCFLLIVTIIIYQQVLLFFVFILILTKMVTAFKVIITTLWMIYGYFLQPCFFFLKVWFNNRSNIKLRLLVILIVSEMLYLLKHIKTPDDNEAIRSGRKHA